MKSTVIEGTRKLLQELEWGRLTLYPRAWDQDPQHHTYQPGRHTFSIPVTIPSTVFRVIIGKRRQRNEVGSNFSWLELNVWLVCICCSREKEKVQIQWKMPESNGNEILPVTPILISTHYWASTRSYSKSKRNSYDLAGVRQTCTRCQYLAEWRVIMEVATTFWLLSFESKYWS